MFHGTFLLLSRRYSGPNLRHICTFTFQVSQEPYETAVSRSFRRANASPLPASERQDCIHMDSEQRWLPLRHQGSAARSLGRYSRWLSWLFSGLGRREILVDVGGSNPPASSLRTRRRLHFPSLPHINKH